MPHALTDIVGARAGACFAGVAADGVVPGVILEKPDGAGEETGGDEVEEAGADYKEDLELSGVAAARVC